MTLHEIFQRMAESFHAYVGVLVLIVALALAYFAWPRSREERRFSRNRRRRDARDRAELLAQRSEVRDLLATRRNQGPRTH